MVGAGEQRESAQPERTKTRPGRPGQREDQRIRETDTWLAPVFLTSLPCF